MNRRGFLAGLLAAAAAPALAAAMPKQPMAYMVFENLDLSAFGPDGGPMPNFEFEVNAGPRFFSEIATLTRRVVTWAGADGWQYARPDGPVIAELASGEVMQLGRVWQDGREVKANLLRGYQ